MKVVHAFFLAIAFFSFKGIALALQANTPEEALEEMVTTDKLQTLAGHLPLQVEEKIDKLDPKQKEELSKKVLVKNLVAGEGGSFRKAEDGVSYELRNEKGEIEVAIRWKDTYISGDEALIALEFSKKDAVSDQRSNQPNTRPAPPKDKDRALILVSMRLQEGAWRLIGFGQWEKKSLEEEFLAGLLRDVTGESDAISTLSKLNMYLRAYRTSYPEVGLPASLGALAGPNGAGRSVDHAMLLDPSFMAVPLIRSGYKFQYTMLDPGATKDAEPRYRITATPMDFGKTRSFFTDQSGMIRATSDSRDANENDEPI